jgi:hypothetical protein
MDADGVRTAWTRLQLQSAKRHQTTEGRSGRFQAGASPNRPSFRIGKPGVKQKRPRAATGGRQNLRFYSNPEMKAGRKARPNQIVTKIPQI